MGTIRAEVPRIAIDPSSILGCHSGISLSVRSLRGQLKPEKVAWFPKMKPAEIMLERAEREHVNVVLDFVGEFQR